MGPLAKKKKKKDIKRSLLPALHCSTPIVDFFVYLPEFLYTQKQIQVCYFLPICT